MSSLDDRFARLGGYVRWMDGSEIEGFDVIGRDMRHVKVGDHVLRKFPGHEGFESGRTMELVVTEVDDVLIYCGPKGSGWSFDRATGAEVDHDFRWGTDVRHHRNVPCRSRGGEAVPIRRQWVTR